MTKQRAEKLSFDFFQSTDVLSLCKSLIGKVLVSQLEGHYTSGVIVEAEAYRGPDDKACHAYNNRHTPRTQVMFKEGGHAYIYLCYGVHHLFNVVTAPFGQAHAVLIRALEPLDGLDIMLARRKMKVIDRKITRGPGALSMAMGFHSNMTGLNMTDSGSSIYIENRGIQFNQRQINAGPRIGVENAGESATWPWRYFVRNNKFVSATNK